ncbi:MAG: amidohydrolase [Candidatus Nezhaarchaeota archaeon]|nr:amidohydrolase [Candidatus Nezhaarchaeota archaeon]
MLSVLIIDFHVHLGPSLVLGVEVTLREVKEAMKEAGVDLAVVFPFPSTAVSQPSIIDWVAEVALADGSLVPFYYVLDDLKPPSSQKFRGAKWHWVRGISDYKSNYEVLRDPRLDEFASAMGRLKIPVIFEEELEFTEEFVDRYPDVLLVIPHVGMLGGAPRDFLKSFKERASVYFDTSLAPASVVVEAVEAVGAERVIFGSDVPFGYMSSELRKIKQLRLSDIDRGAILGGNAAKLLKLSL